MDIVRHEPGKILSGAVEAGELVFVAGTTPDTLTLDCEGQTREVLAKIDALLKKAGSHKSRIVSASIWVTDIRNRDAMNRAWIDWMDPANPPARATVEAKLADARMLVEIACVAVKGAAPAKAASAKKAAKAAPKKAAPAKPAAKAAPDDLEVIEGVGPKIAQILAKAGMSTYQSLAAAQPKAIKALLENAGPRFKLADPGTWPQQAALLARGQREAFEKLVASLRGGVKG